MADAHAATMPITWRRSYSRAEVIADAAIHAVGLVGALAAVPVLVTLAATWRDDAALLAAITIYGLTLIAMLAFSASYNIAAGGLAAGRTLDWLRRLDHAGIYLKIAGTYTPFAVFAGGPAGHWILVGVWSGAALGTIAKLVAPWGWERWSLTLYLALGWGFALGLGPVSRAVSGPTLALIVVGGCLYSVGVLFHVWQRLPFQNAIWHLFVLVASFVFYAAMVVEVVAGA